MIIVCLNQQIVFTSYNLYSIEVDRNNRNCYNCEGFRHLARNCRNRGMGDRIGEERRLEYGQGNNKQKRMIKEEEGQNSNLNGDRDLIVLN